MNSSCIPTKIQAGLGCLPRNLGLIDPDPSLHVVHAFEPLTLIPTPRAITTLSLFKNRAIDG
ncbi:hypothetical protein ACRALDRAFT_2014938 [Sodiomyces alcalophilus JCM 7366]|uniref:uncharacterized protein n=1 Tax=Sodiomyces alcalophilus JCM 7366 TaxID=591952 RepID=UPI0039B6A4FB